MTAVVLNRPRHAELIAEIRETGARIRLIEDNDVGAAISTAWPDSGVDILFGVGGSPEAVISATALRCMGGMFQARLWPRNEREREAAIAGGFPLGQALGIDELVSSDNCFFAATGVTHGDLLAGVRVDGAHVWTESLAMRSRSGTVRKFVSRHRHE